MLFLGWELYRCAYHLISSDVGMWGVDSKCFKGKVHHNILFPAHQKPSNVSQPCRGKMNLNGYTIHSDTFCGIGPAPNMCKEMAWSILGHAPKRRWHWSSTWKDSSAFIWWEDGKERGKEWALCLISWYMASVNFFINYTSTAIILGGGCILMFPFYWFEDWGPKEKLSSQSHLESIWHK